jgi:hypothetical protein
VVNFCSPKSGLRTEMTKGILLRWCYSCFIMNSFLLPCMRVPWNFHGICAFQLFVLKRIFSYNTPYTLKWRCHNLPRSRKLLWNKSSSVATTQTWFAKVSRTNIQMYDALHRLHVRIRDGHRTSGYSFVKLWRTKFMLLLRRNPDTLKALCCGVNCGIAISKCTGYYTRKCVSAQTTRKHKFHGTLMGVKMNS